MGLLLLVGLMAGVPLFYSRVDELVRAEAERKLNEHSKHLAVRVGDAKLIEGHGIELRDVVFYDSRRGESDAVTLEVREIFLSCRADLQALASRKLDVSRIELREPLLRLRRQPDGTWRGVELFEFSSPEKQAVPPISVVDGTVELSQRAPAGAVTAPARPLRLSGVNLRSEASRFAEDGSRISAFRGTLGGDHLKKATFEGKLCFDTRAWVLAGQLDQLRVTPELIASLPIDAAALPGAARSLRAEVGADFQAVSDAAAPWGFRFELQGSLNSGRCDDPRLDHPLTGIEGQFTADLESVELRDFRAACGATQIEVQCGRSGYFDGGPMWVDLHIRDLELGKSLQRLLPPSLAALWPQYDPAGRVHLDGRLDFDGAKWTPRGLTVQCVDLSFAHYKCPYRAENGRGTIVLTPDDRLEIQLTVEGGGEPIDIRGTILQATSGPVGRIDVTAPQLQIDKNLIRALAPNTQKVIRSLHPSGTVRLTATLANDGPGRPFEPNLRIGLNRCSAWYEKFAYPLFNIEGTIRLVDRRWHFENLIGHNDTAVIRCNGALNPTGDGHEMRLHFDAKRVPLEEELRNAFPQPNVRGLWDDLKLRGMVDVQVDMYHRSGQEGVRVSFDAFPYPDQTSVQPAWFPYRLENLQGQIGYRDGHVVIQEMRSQHGDVKVATSASCDFDEDGSWRLDLDDLTIDQLRVDREFLETAPAPLKAAVAPLKLQGPLNLRGRVVLAQSGQRAGPVRADWDLAVALHQINADIGLPVESVCGGFTIRGCHAGDVFYCTGDLGIDSLVYRGVQVTALKGPFWVGRDRILLGRSVPVTARGAGSPDAPSALPRSLTARTLGGQVACDGWVGIDDQQRYHLLLSLNKADLTTLTREFAMQGQTLGGMIDARAEVSGRGRNLDMLQANGSVRLRQADVYELPLMTSLLQILSIREPERAVFSEADVVFRVQSGHILFDDIEFQGNAFSLKGRGEMDLDQQRLKLRLGTRFGRPDGQAPFLREMLGAAGEQIVVVDVEGPLSDPEIKRKPFPVVSEAFEQLQNDLYYVPQATAPAQRQGPTALRPPEPRYTPPFWRF